MKLIPSVIADSTTSDAERRVFGLLACTDLGPGAVSLHSLNLPSHAYKRMGEIDFVVLAPAGLLVVEVKGGRVRRRDEDGRWEFTDRYGHVAVRSEGPFAQARSAMFAVRDELAKRVPASLVDRTSFGYCVMFPDVTWSIDSVDEPRELVIDEPDVRGADLARPLVRLLKRWAWTNARGSLEPSELRDLRKGLRPTFDLVPSLRVRADEARRRLESLTEEQYVGLDWVEQHPRLLVAGGAGTGKTLLAAEIARRDAARGRVLLTCQSPALAAHIATRCDHDRVDVLPIEEARRAAAAGGRWEILVVDEAQDIFSAEGLDLLEELVEGGVEQGTWRIFYDVNNQAGLYGEVDDGLLDLLRDAGGQPVQLRRNCRNAKPVVLHTQTLTGADLGQPLAGEGPVVRTAFPATREEEAKLVTEELARLARQDVPAGEITILSFKERDDSVVTLLPAALARTIESFDHDVAEQWPRKRMTFAHIDDFKGFENDFVLVVDIDSLDDDRAHVARLYIAMSRARYGLWLAVPAALEQRFQKLRTTNLAAVLAGLEDQQ